MEKENSPRIQTKNYLVDAPDCIELTADQPLPIISSKRKPINARTILWYMVFCGFAVDYMIRININITIVDMIIPDEPSIRNDTSAVEKNRTSLERSLMELLKIDYAQEGFDWDEKQEGQLIGSFFWLYWITQIPGGMLARRFGGKRIFGLTNLTASLICCVMPLCAFYDHKLLVFLRVIQGLICGMSWPAVHTMFACWVPPHERSKFVTAYHGSAIGIAIFYPLFGYIVSVLSWEWPYYICGLIGTTWFACWQYFAYDKPELHPRIDPVEKEFIELSLGDSNLQEEALPIPWRAIVTSPALWTIAVAQWGSEWCSSTLLAQGPTYFQRIHNWSIEIVGLLTGLPHLMKLVSSHVFSVVGELLIRRQLMSTTNVRKAAAVVSSGFQGALVLALAFSGQVTHLPVIFFALAVVAQSAVSTGPLANLVDLSPNFSGITVGIVEMFTATTSFLSPLLVSHITLNNQTQFQWKCVFFIAATFSIACVIPYLLFSTSKTQKWNGPHILTAEYEMAETSTNEQSDPQRTDNKNNVSN